MIDLILSPAAEPFAIALGLVIAIAAVELVSMMLGASVSSAVDSLLPDLELDAEIDVAGGLESASPDIPDAPGPGPLSTVLGWLCVGRVPVLVLLILFLSAFGVTGLAVQNLSNTLIGLVPPGWVAAIPAVVAALPFTRGAGLIFARIMPKEETEAVSQKTFIGKMAQIIRGQARQGQPAEAKLTDSFGQQHYVLVEPDSPDATFGPQEFVLIVSQQASIYRAVRTDNPAMAPNP